MAARTTKPKPAEQLAAAPAPAVRFEALSPEALAELRRPFMPAAIRFKPQVVTKEAPFKGMSTFYIDARLAAERLNAVVGPEGWSDDYTVLFHDNAAAHAGFYFPVECRLTVLGVTKVDVGNYQANKGDDKAVKSAYSDALKRAAVKFGVAAYLYGFPKVWAPVKMGSNGKAQGFTPEGERELRRAYEQHLRQLADHFGAPLDHGDVGSDPDVDEPAEAAADASPATPAGDDPKPEPAASPAMVTDKGDITKLKALAEQAGFSKADVVKVCKAEYEEHGGYRRSWYQGQMRDLTKMITEKAAA